MNRIFRFMTMACVCITSLSLFTACQKDEPTVDLNAVVADHPSSGAKVYINGLYGCWQNGDQVRLRSGSNDDKSYSLSVASDNGVTAKITGVTEGTPYTAGYPAANVSNVDNGTLQMCIPSEQNYESAATPGGTAQRIVSPMAAYSADGALLKFYNVGALLKVDITNGYSEPLTFYSVEVESDNAPLAGTANVTVTADAANISGDVSNDSKTVALNLSGANVSVAAGATATLYIPVLPIDASAKSKLTVHVKATGANGKYTFHGVSSSSNEGVWIGKNQMGTIPITLNASGKTSVNSHFWGQGTEDCPYLIENQTDLETLCTAVNAGNTFSGKHLKLTQNIDAKGTDWVAIGTSTYKFQGIFDGGNHTVTMTMNPNQNGYGFFGYINGATIRNLTVSGTCESNTTNYNIGGICGQTDGASTFDNCVNTIDIKGSYNVAGIVGYSGGKTKLERCTNTGDISATGDNSNSGAAGIVASLFTSEVAINKCKNTGTISVSGSNMYIAGIAAFSNVGGTIYNCVNTGDLSAVSGFAMGGILGRIRAALNIANCYCTSTMTGSVKYGAGIMGLSEANTFVNNCYFAGDISGLNISDMKFAISCKYSSTNHKVYNCYYGEACGTTISTNADKDCCTKFNDSGVLSSTINKCHTLNSSSGSTVSYTTLKDALQGWVTNNGNDFVQWSDDDIPALNW